MTQSFAGGSRSRPSKHFELPLLSLHFQEVRFLFRKPWSRCMDMTSLSEAQETMVRAFTVSVHPWKLCSRFHSQAHLRLRHAQALPPFLVHLSSGDRSLSAFPARPSHVQLSSIMNDGNPFPSVAADPNSLVLKTIQE